MWFSEMGSRVGNGLKRRSHNDSSDQKQRPKDKSKTLAILSFETGKTMSRLVSLYKSITDEEITKLRKETVKSEGVSFLISTDEEFLLKLACTEKLEEIDRAAATVARLGKTCCDSDLMQFDRVYADLKLGFIDLSNYFVEKEIEKTMEKLEKYVATTAELYEGLESLAEMEISEKKLKNWNINGQILNIPQKNQKNPKSAPQKANFDLFEQKIAWQRSRVRHLRQVSLWGQTFDKIVRLMARAICIVFARMCVVFSPYISIMPRTIPAPTPEPDSVGLVHQAGPSTAGNAGLMARYANIILIAERFLNSRNSLDEGGREEMYNMLPANLRGLMNMKLKKIIREEEPGPNGDKALVEQWREVAKQKLRWLSPVAHDTIRWKMERNVEKQNFDARPKVLMLQTFYFADKVKTEQAIAEVLVGLSCICRYQPKRPTAL